MSGSSASRALPSAIVLRVTGAFLELFHSDKHPNSGLIDIFRAVTGASSYIRCKFGLKSQDTAERNLPWSPKARTHAHRRRLVIGPFATLLNKDSLEHPVVLLTPGRPALS
jgi:hypothetical protein